MIVRINKVVENNNNNLFNLYKKQIIKNMYNVSIKNHYKKSEGI